MSIMGVCGILDHCGVRIQVRLFYVLYQCAIKNDVVFCSQTPLGIYDTKFHDLHHSAFNVNFAFPFPVMDVVHGTAHRAK